MKSIENSAVRILLLEDDEDMREILCSVLEDQGYLVTAVSGGEAAVEEAKRCNFDLMVTDIKMQGMDGLEALEKTQSLQPGLGSLVVTGYANEKEMSRAQSLNVGGLLKKPFKMADLLRLVQEQLKQERSVRAQRQENEILVDALRCALQGVMDLGRHADRCRSASELADRLCQALGFTEQVREQCSMAVGLRLTPSLKLPDDFMEGSTSLDLLHSLSHPDRQARLGLGSRVVWVTEVATAAFTERDFDDPMTWDELPSHLQIDGLDSFYQQCIRGPVPEISREVTAGLADPLRSQRTMLALGRTLEQIGQLDGARSAYQETYLNSVGEMRAEAAICLARIESKAGNKEAVTALVAQNSDYSRSLGPVSDALCRYRLALNLLRVEPELATSSLEQLIPRLESLGLLHPLCSSKMAVALVSKESRNSLDWELISRVLFAPIHRMETQEQLSWLLPCLLELATYAERPAVVADAFAAFPYGIVNLLSKTEMPEEQFRFVSSVLLEASSADEEVAQSLLSSTLKRSQELGAQLLRRKSGLAQRKNILRIHSFGFFEVFQGADRIPDSAWRTQKTKYLLAYLAAKFPRPVHEESLQETFWPDDLRKGRKSLNTSISSLRTVLGTNSIAREKELIALNSEQAVWHDVLEFQKCLQQVKAETNSSESMLPTTRAATQLYRGPYLDGCFSDWALNTRSQIEQDYIELLSQLCDHHLANRQFREALEQSQKAFEQASYRQDLFARLLKSLIGLGQCQEAIRRYEKFCNVLKHEYESEPSTELFRLYHEAKFAV
jgi:two-component SAPR family response regulator